jgi:hypothetical protein
MEPPAPIQLDADAGVVKRHRRKRRHSR